MTASELVASTSILAAAGFAHGMFGIGFAMIATPMLASFLDYRLAVLLSAPALLAMAVSWLLAHARTRGCVAQQAILLPGIAVGAVAGAALQTALPEQVALSLLALLLAGSLAIPWMAGRRAIARLASARQGAPWFGLLAGLTESAMNVGAPFMLLYGGLARLSRFEQLLALNLCFALSKSIQITLMAMAWPASATGAVTALTTGTVASLAAYWAGNRYSGSLSEAHFRRLLRNFIVCMVAVLLARVAMA